MQRAAESFLVKLRRKRFRDADLFLRNELDHNCDLNGAYSGKRAFVLGTGPSLSLLDLSRIKDEVTFGLNSFYRHKIASSWSPTFYCLNDPSWFMQDGKCGPMNKYLSEIQSICSGSTFLVSLTAARESVMTGQLPPTRTRLVSFAGYEPGDFIWQPRLDRSLPAAYNIVHSVILEAMALGCNPIYVLGCDQDINVFTFTWKHFYQESKEEEQIIAGCQQSFDESEYYHHTYGLRFAYNDLLRISKQWDFKIYNATRGGGLQSFERVDYDSLF
jgi:hypothetical protein